MPGLTMTDCSVADNVTQARYEFERAMTTSGYAALSTWAVKWARSLLDVAAENIGKIEPDRHHSAMREADCSIEALENEICGIHTSIRAAITKLESCL